MRLVAWVLLAQRMSILLQLAQRMSILLLRYSTLSRNTVLFFNAGNQRCLSDFCIVVYDVEIKPFREFDRKSSWISLDSFDFNGFYYWKE